MKLTAIQRDTTLEEEGQWFLFHDDFEIKVRSLRSMAFQAALEKARRPHKQQLARKNPPDDLVAGVMREAVAHGLVIDWRGLEDDDGPIAFSPEKAVELFSSKGLEELYEFVLDVARDSDAWRIGDEDDSGN